MLRSLPDSLLVEICSVLSVGEAALVLAHVVRRTGLRVSWTAVTLAHVTRSIAAAAHYGPLYQAVSQLALAPRLQTFKAILDESTVSWIDDVLAASTNLQCLGLHVLDDGVARLSQLSQVRRHKSSVTDLELSLYQACYQDMVTSNEPVTTFLAGFVALDTFAFDFYDIHPDIPDHWAAEALRSLEPGCLLELRVSGGLGNQKMVAKTIVELQPRLTSLNMAVHWGDDKELKENGALHALESCSFSASRWSDLAFIERLDRLRDVRVHVADNRACEWVLPRGVVEFESGVGICPASLLPKQLEALTILVCKENVAGLAQRLPTMASLGSLCLIVRPQCWPKVQGQLMASRFACPGVRRLRLQGFGFGQGLLKSFPGLKELECELSKGRPCLDAFRLCPDLQTITVNRLRSVVTFGRRADGRIVRRENSERVLI